MVGKIGEDLEKDFERQLENCTTQVSVGQNTGSKVLASTRLGFRAPRLHRIRPRDHRRPYLYKL